MAPTIGITGTPTINPVTNTMYVVAATKENGAYFLRLHAINILTGAEQQNSPVAITATVAGTGNGSSGGKLSFSPLWANQRSGAGMPIDENAPGGRMFVVTGNGNQSAYPPFSPSSSLGESVINFSLANGGLKPTNAYTAFNKTYLNKYDLDLGAGGLLMPPDQQSDQPHILVVAGKEGRIVVLNRDDLDGYDSDASDPKALQDIPDQLAACWCVPAYWNGKVYF